MGKEFCDVGKMVKEDLVQRAEGELKVGEMPQPEYLIEAGDTTGSENIKWIGIRAYDLDQQIRSFLWWRNFQVDLGDEKGRHDAAAFVTRLKLETKAEAAFGLPIDLRASDSSRDYVAVVEDPSLYGVYIEAGERLMFNFRVGMEGVKTEEVLRAQHPFEFDKIFRKAEAVLPYPTKK